MMVIDPLPGIPGSTQTALRQVRWHRLPDRPAGRCYHALVPDGELHAIVSRDPAGKGGWALWHLSVSHRATDGQLLRCPTWDELKHARYQLIQEDVPMVLIFPRRSAPYVNVHETCLHLWEAEGDIDL